VHCTQAQELRGKFNKPKPPLFKHNLLQVRQQNKKGPVICNKPAGWFCLVSTHANIAWILAHVDTIHKVQHIIIHRPYTCLTGGYSTQWTITATKFQLHRHQSSGQRCVFTTLSPVFWSDSW